MPLPILTQLIDAFLGSSESIHSVILPDVYSSGGSKNLWIDKYGRAKRIQGYAAQNATAVTTDTGGSATMGRALFPYRKTSGGSTTRQLLGVFDDQTNEYEIWKSTNDGATWVFVADLGAAVVGQIPDFGQQGDTLIITTGKVAPRKWNGTSLTTAGVTQSPTVASAAGATGNLAGTYKWKLVSLFAADGSRKGGSVASTVLALSNVKASLTWTADADTLVGGYELYRTSGTGEIYYFVAYIDGRVTASYTDNFSDPAIVVNRILEEHGDAPPTAYFAVPHKQRMWYLRTDTNPQIGYWSDTGIPDSVLATNSLQFADATTQGDVCTGGTGDYEGKLVFWEERSVWTVSGTGEIIGDVPSWARTRTNAQTGTVSHRTVARIPAGSRYPDQLGKIQVTNVATLAYLTPLKDIRLFDGDNDLVISNPKATQLAELNFAQRHKAYCVQDTHRQEVAWVYPSGSSGEPDSAVVWNYRWGVWYEREWPFGHAIEMDSSAEGSILLATEALTATGGYVYLLWSGNSFNGASFRSQWMSKTLYGINEQGQPAISIKKRFRWADLGFETEQTVTLTIEWLEATAPDNGAALGSITFAPATAALLTADGDPILTANGDPIVVSSTSTFKRLKIKDNHRYHHGYGVRLRVYDDAQNGSWSLESINQGFQLLPGQKREPS